MLGFYHKTVGRGAQLVPGLAPDDRGLMAEVDVARPAEFGKAVKALYANNLTTAVTQSATGSVAAFASAKTFDRTVAMEWLVEGQHIASCAIEASDDGRVWKILHRGPTVGHKKIDIFPGTAARQVRLRILNASGTPKIRQFVMFDGGGK